MKLHSTPCWITVVAALLLASCAATQMSAGGVLIENALILDGTGSPGYPGSVRIEGDRILALGNLRKRPGEIVIDAEGLVLAPGFIDTHSHHDADIDKYPSLPAVLSQGVTTIVRGVDGASDVESERRYVPVSEFNARFGAAPAAVNVASLAPHGSIRYAVMGEDSRRAATGQEIAAMARLVDADMRAGAIGLSTGLEYEPGIYATTEEVIELAKVSAAYGGGYVSHVRDEDDLFMTALEEIIRIAREAAIRVHVSHIKLADRALWGTTTEVLGRLDAARADGVEISADIYPYLRWQSDLAVLFPDRDFTNRQTAEFTFEHTAAASDIILAAYPPNPAYAGMSVAAVARATGRDEVSTLLELAGAAEEYRTESGLTGSSIIAKGMHEDDVARLLGWRYTNVCSDGSHESGHPRGHGAFPRVFRRFVRELGVLTLEEAVHKMTGLAAAAMGIQSRGRIEPGAYADLVLFDAGTIADRATMAEPARLPVGVLKVWVNGELAFDRGVPTGALAGRILTLGD